VDRELGHEERPARVRVRIADRQDVPVREPAQDPCFQPLAPRRHREQQLDRDDVPLVRVECLVHLTLAAHATDLALQVVATPDQRHGRHGMVQEMRIAGIAVEPKAGRPVARLVVVTGTAAAPTIDSCFKFTSSDVPIPEQVHDLAEDVRSRLKGVAVERVLLRRADFAPIPSNKPGPRIRLLAEGAVLAAARSVVPDTVLGTGLELAQRYGQPKPTHEQDAAALVAAVGEHQDYVAATAAALAGLS
jgi:hypothetical protein